MAGEDKPGNSDEQSRQPHRASSRSNDPLEAALLEYQDAWYSGNRIDPNRFCKSHPECGEELSVLIDHFILVAEGFSAASKQEDSSERTLGDFRILREIGQGGMGVVYEAEQISLKRKVALKVLPAHLSFSDVMVKKFYREAEAGGRQRHPGVVAVHAIGEHEGAHFIVQELIEGGRTLADEIDVQKELGEPPRGYFRDVAELILKVATALQHAHESGVIHRDLKPSNILLTKEGDPKVSDFGLAKIEDALALSRTGDFSGTPYYMSPEQAASKRIGIDRRTDIYSLGVTLYEMLTLNRPFDGDTSQEVLKKILLVDAVDPQKANPLAPRDLSVICLKAIEKLPDRRYQTMDEFAAELQRFLFGDVILAKPAGMGTRFWKRVKRHPVVSAVTGVTLLAIAVFAVVVPWVIAKEEKENSALLKIERNKAIEAKRESDERYNQIIRLSDIKRLSELHEKADALWPAYPENIPGLEDWLARADEVLARLDGHRETLSSFRKTALPYGETELRKDRETHPRWEALLELKNSRLDLEELIASIESGPAKDEGSADGPREGEAAPDPDALKEQLATLDALIGGLEETVSLRRTWDFEDTETKWQHDMVMGLVSGLEALTAEKEGLLESVWERLAFATTIKEKSVADHRAAWDEAIASIADRAECPRYNGLVIEEKVGFVPIGRDPASGLWEFAHLQTGEIPRRDPDGKIVRTEEMGLVFVLIPGGAFNMGAVPPAGNNPAGSPNRDPEARADEGPVHAVTVEAFFLSKYEMTQGQWFRFTGKNPSVYGAESNIGGRQHDLLHPVENVSWYDCSEILFRLKLRLPTESEWEYAARAGTSAIFWTGVDKQSLQGAANIADHYLKNNGGEIFKCEETLNDGYSVHAPVGTFSPNAFGLHDVHGNLFEWCEDIHSDSYEHTPVDGSANKRGPPVRVVRGGSWRGISFHCRSAYRGGNDAEHRYDVLGLRPSASCP